MKINQLRKAMAPFLLTASAVAGAQLVDQAGVSGSPADVPFGGPVVLYDQTGQPPSGNGAPDQNFEAAFDAYDAIVADDFVVTDPNGWNITQVSSVGTYSVAGPAAGVSISFHADLGGSPDPTPVAGCSFPSVVPTTDTTGSFVIDLGAGCDLPAGTFWMAQQTDLDFAGGAGGQHFFSNTQTVTGAEGHWINPGDGFGSGCTTFQPAGSVCGVGGGGTTDFLFSVSGSVLAPTPALPVPAANWYGMALLLLGMGFFGRRFLKNN
ncbi:hypothetical protein ACFODZ_09745 [Marinicella sediminis]|uniref:IPTL-CTERM sorting domain-containing protein n=1 Tax=Marinicella sediminis TaxID=1792834 RepID=A0ABV7JCD7_9GAMM|nr:hypothetical protein [Marinicella sediminis]